MPLDKYLRRRLTTPLEMYDTAFYVNENKAYRLAKLHGSDEGGERSEYKWGSRTGGEEGFDYLTKPTLFSGGNGLVSTARDYLRQVVFSGIQRHPSI